MLKNRLTLYQRNDGLLLPSSQNITSSKPSSNTQTTLKPGITKLGLLTPLDFNFYPVY